MRTALIAAALLVACVGFAAEGQPAASQPLWLTSWEDAAQQAKDTGKPVLINFTGSDWCGWCIRLKKEVFSTAEFQQWAAKNVILLEVDFPRKKAQSAEEKKRNQELARKYGIRGYPTIIFADATGKDLGRSGYMEGGPKAWTAHADTIIAKAAPAK